MQRKFKKPLLMFAFSPILIAPLFIVTSCGNNGMKNVDITYDKKINVTDFFSSHNKKDTAWDVSSIDGFISSHSDWQSYFTSNGDVSINNNKDVSDLMGALDWKPTNIGYNPFSIDGFVNSLTEVYICPYEDQKSGNQYWYVYVSFNDSSNFSSQTDMFMIDWTLSISATGDKSYTLKSRSDDTQPWNYGAHNSYVMNLEQSTELYSQEDSVTVSAFCNRIATNDEENPYIGGNGDEISAPAWSKKKVEIGAGDGTFIDISSLLVGGSPLTSETNNGKGKDLSIHTFTKDDLETAMNAAGNTGWKLNKNTGVIRVIYAFNATGGYELPIDFILMGSNDKNPSNFKNWKLDPTKTKNFDRNDFLQIGSDYNKPSDKPNSKTMLDFFNKDVDGNFIIRNLLNQMMDASRDDTQYNKIRVTCDRIEIKNNGKNNQGFWLHSFKIKNLKAELCNKDFKTGNETNFFSYTINTNKEISIAAASMVSSAQLPRWMNHQETTLGATMEDPSIPSLNYYLPVLYYGSLVNGAVDTLHPVQNNDIFKIDYLNNSTKISYSTNTFWSVIPSYSCYRETECTSNVNYCFPATTSFPQIL